MEHEHATMYRPRLPARRPKGGGPKKAAAPAPTPPAVPAAEAPAAGAAPEAGAAPAAATPTKKPVLLGTRVQAPTGLASGGRTEEQKAKQESLSFGYGNQRTKLGATACEVDSSSIADTTPIKLQRASSAEQSRNSEAGASFGIALIRVWQSTPQRVACAPNALHAGASFILIDAPERTVFSWDGAGARRLDISLAAKLVRALVKDPTLNITKSVTASAESAAFAKVPRARRVRAAPRASRRGVAPRHRVVAWPELRGLCRLDDSPRDETNEGARRGRRGGERAGIARWFSRADKTSRAIVPGQIRDD